MSMDQDAAALPSIGEIRGVSQLQADKREARRPSVSLARMAISVGWRAIATSRSFRVDRAICEDCAAGRMHLGQRAGSAWRTRVGTLTL
jgi:hypothetical protein